MTQDKLMKEIDDLYKAYGLIYSIFYSNTEKDETVKNCLTAIKECIKKFEDKLEY